MWLKERQGDSQMIKKFISFYKPYKLLFTLDLAVAFVASLCDLVYPMMTRQLVNDSIPSRDIRLIIIFAITLLIIFIIKAACGYFMQYWGHVIGVRMQGDMRRDIFKHLQKLPNSFFDNNKTGDIMSRIINDLMDISELAHHGPEDLFISIIMLIGSFVILCTINVPLTILIFAFIPFIVWFTLYQRKRMNKAFLKTKVETGAVNASLENSISGIKISKAFDIFIPEILFSRLALTAPVSTLVLRNALFILFLWYNVNHTIKGINANINIVRGTLIVHNITNEPISIIIDINKSSGPWWASSEMSIKSLIILDIISPVLLLSKKLLGNFWRCLNISLRISPCILTPITCPQYCIKYPQAALIIKIISNVIAKIIINLISLLGIESLTSCLVIIGYTKSHKDATKATAKSKVNNNLYGL